MWPPENCRATIASRGRDRETLSQHRSAVDLWRFGNELEGRRLQLPPFRRAEAPAPRAGTPAPQCGAGVLARQIAENGVQMSKLQRPQSGHWSLDTFL